MSNVEVSQFPARVSLKNFRRKFDDLTDCSSLHDACVVLAEVINRLGLKVHAITFVDTDNEFPSIRPYRDQPDVLVQISKELQKSGGCPIIQRAKTFGEVFDAKALPLAEQKEFLAKRYLGELRKLPSKQVLVFPVSFGRGLAVFSIGTGERHYETAHAGQLHLEISLCVVALLSRFPDLSRLFAPKTLSLIQSQFLFLLSTGANHEELSETFGLSELTVHLVLNSAIKKLNANSLAHAVAQAQRIGEIKSMDIGDHDLT